MQTYRDHRNASDYRLHAAFRCLCLATSMASSSCTIAWSDVQAKPMRVSDPSDLNGYLTYVAYPDVAKAKCIAHYVGVVTTDAASVRRDRRTAALLVTLATGLAATAMSVFTAVSLQKDPPDVPRLAVLGVTAGVAGVSPLVDLIASSFEPKYADLNKKQGILENYVEGAVLRTNKAGPGAQKDGDYITGIMDDALQPLIDEYGSGDVRDSVAKCSNQLRAAP